MEAAQPMQYVCMGDETYCIWLGIGIEEGL